MRRPNDSQSAPNEALSLAFPCIYLSLYSSTNHFTAASTARYGRAFAEQRFAESVRAYRLGCSLAKRQV